MPEMVVVSVLPEEEDALHSVAWSCPLPCAARQVLWIRRTCFIARLTFTCDQSLVGFPVAFWKHQLKMCLEVLPRWYSCCVGWVPCLTCRMSSLFFLSHVAPREPHLCWCGTGLDVVASFCSSSVLQTRLFLLLPFGLLWGWWLCGSTCARADSAALSAVQDELGRSPAGSAVPLTVGEIDEQVSPQKCEAETDSKHLVC